MIGKRFFFLFFVSLASWTKLEHRKKIVWVVFTFLMYFLFIFLFLFYFLFCFVLILPRRKTLLLEKKLFLSSGWKPRLIRNFLPVLFVWEEKGKEKSKRKNKKLMIKCKVFPFEASHVWTFDLLLGWLLIFMAAKVFFFSSFLASF